MLHAVQNDLPVVVEDLLDHADVVVQNVGVSVKKLSCSKELKLTGLAQDRYERLVAQVEKDRFMLRPNLLHFFQVRPLSTSLQNGQGVNHCFSSS